MNIDRQRLVESKREQRRRVAELPGIKPPRDDGTRVESRTNQRRRKDRPGEWAAVEDRGLVGVAVQEPRCKRIKKSFTTY